MEKSLYWAGDRGFRSCMRWHDEETIKALEQIHGWVVNYPFDESIEVDEESCEGFFGKRGLLRRKCLTGVDNSAVVVAYLGSHDAGTAQEIEYALMRGKPILGWSDSAIVVGEHAGRRLTTSQKNLDALQVTILPMNGMTAVMDRYIEFSELGSRTSPGELAEIINKEAEKLL